MEVKCKQCNRLFGAEELPKCPWCGCVGDIEKRHKINEQDYPERQDRIIAEQKQTITDLEQKVKRLREAIDEAIMSINIANGSNIDHVTLAMARERLNKALKDTEGE